jgi:hypothetical protein
MMKMQPKSLGVLALGMAALLIGKPASAQDIGVSALFTDVTGLAVAVDEQDSLAGKTPSPKGSSGSRKARTLSWLRGSTAASGVPDTDTRDAKTPGADVTRAGTSH